MRSDINPFTGEPSARFDQATRVRQKRLGALTDDFGNEVLVATGKQPGFSTAHQVTQECGGNGPHHFVCRRCGMKWLGKAPGHCTPHAESLCSGYQRHRLVYTYGVMHELEAKWLWGIA